MLVSFIYRFQPPSLPYDRMNAPDLARSASGDQTFSAHRQSFVLVLVLQYTKKERKRDSPVGAPLLRRRGRAKVFTDTSANTIHHKLRNELGKMYCAFERTRTTHRSERASTVIHVSVCIGVPWPRSTHSLASYICLSWSLQLLLLMLMSMR